MTGDAAAREAAAGTRWDRWQDRYARSSRRRTVHARWATAVIFAAIVANLVVQLVWRTV